jgi:hypothetical protein
MMVIEINSGGNENIQIVVLMTILLLSYHCESQIQMMGLGLLQLLGVA